MKSTLFNSKAAIGLMTLAAYLSTGLCASEVSRAFKGAEGFGAQANGWRQSSAQILFVDNLNDDGPGSFRAAYSAASGPRYIIFRVGGYIPVRSDLVAENGNLYVAGQTAPGDGITLKGECSFPYYDGLYISGSHICVRYLRVRNHSGSENAWGLALHGASDSIVDHCSVSWATDDQLMMATTIGRVTIQNTIGAECRAYMMTFYGPSHGPCSAHHNYLAGGGQRNPLAQGGAPSEFSHNLVYNWGGYLGTACDIYDYGGYPIFDLLNNYYKWGPETGWANAQPGWNDPALGYEFWANNPNVPGTLHFSGNHALLPAASGGFVNARLNNQGHFNLVSSKLAAPTIPITLQDMSTQARADAWAAQLLSHVGCSKPRRDAYDQFLIKAYSDFTGWDGCGATTEYDSPFTIANGGNPWPPLANGTPLSLKPSGMTQEFINRMGLANTVGSALSTSISQARGLGEDYQNIEWCLMEQAGDVAPLTNQGGGGTPPPATQPSPAPAPAPAPNPTLPTTNGLTAAPGVVQPGGAISVSWTVSQPNALDWIGLYAAGTGNTSYLDWSYTDGAVSGSLTFNAPDTFGTYEFRYLVNDGYTSTLTSNVFTVGSGSGNEGGQTPFGGAAMAIPGTIGVARYDNGGEGVAYHDTDHVNQMSSTYRAGSGVDSDGSGVGWILGGEWLEYTVHVSAAGTYALSIPLCQTTSGGTMHVTCNGVNVTGSMSVPNTGSWSVMQTITKTVSLSAGTQVMQVAFDANGANGYGPGLGDISISAAGGAAYGGVPMTVPGTIKVAQYDHGGEGVAYHDLEAWNLMSGTYRVGEGVDSEGTRVGWISASEWLKYTVHVSAAGPYALTIPLSHPGTGGTMHVSVNGVNVTGSINLPTTATWDTYQNVTRTVNLSAGAQVLQVHFDTNGSTGYGPGLQDIRLDYTPTGSG